MDNTESPHKPRWFARWFSPLRWRFWAIVLPLLLIATSAVLLAWPRLVYDWRINDHWYLKRSFETFRDGEDNDFVHVLYVSEGQRSRDTAILRAGALIIWKLEIEWSDESHILHHRGAFYANPRPDRWEAGYASKPFSMAIEIAK
jgi:hypothetical protein